VTRRPLAEALPFQDEVDALVHEPAPLFLRLWPLLGVAMLAGLLGLAAVAKVDVVVTAQGRLVPEVPPVVLLPGERSVLREARVQPGQRVRAGEVVALLDATAAQADRDALQAQRRTLSARRARLEAELEGRPPPAPTDAESALEAQLHLQRHGVQLARRLALEAELRAVEGALRAEEADRGGGAAQLAIAREVEAMRARLAEGQVGSRLNLLAARAARLEAEQAQARREARVEELRQRVDSRRAELASALADWRRSLLDELAPVRLELARLDENIAKASLRAAMTRLEAPRDAVVLEVARRAPGSLLPEAEPVAVLVPLDVPLLAEVGLRSADVGRLAPGHAAKLKIDAFPWRRHGALAAELRDVSRESFSPGGQAGGAMLHRGRVALPPGAAFADGSQPLPGMTLTAEVTVGSRSVLGFFLEPLLRGLSESLREP